MGKMVKNYDDDDKIKGVTVTLRNVRLSWPSLSKPSDYKGDKNFKFRATLLLGEDDEQASMLEEAILALQTEKKWKGKRPSKVLFNKDDCCALVAADHDKTSDGYEGMIVITTANKKRPTLITRSKKPIDRDDADDILVAGCYVTCKFELWPQDNDFGKRINASLQVIQFFEEGAEFGGGHIPDNAADDFEELDEDDDDDDDEEDFLD